MREHLLRLLPLCLVLVSPAASALWEDDGTPQSRSEASPESNSAPRSDFVRITRASGERHERQISRRLFQDPNGERHVITVDRNGNVLQFRRPPFFPLQQPSPFRQQQPLFFPQQQQLQPSQLQQQQSLQPFLPQQRTRGSTRSRSSHGFSRRRFPQTTTTPLPTVTHDGAMATATILVPSEPTTVTRPTLTHGLRRLPPPAAALRVADRFSARVDSFRLVHGGSMERGRSEESEDEGEEEATVLRPVSRPLKPLRVSSSFEQMPRRDNDRFRIGPPAFGDITTTAEPRLPASSTSTTAAAAPRVFIQTPRPLRPQRPPPRQRPQPPRRVDQLSSDSDQEFVPSGRNGASPSVVTPFRSFRPRIPPARFTLPPRFGQRPGSLPPLRNSPTSSSSSATTPLTFTEPTTTPSTTMTTTETTTVATTTPSTTTTQTTTAPSTTTTTEATTTSPSTTLSTTPSTTTTRRVTRPLSTTRTTTARKHQASLDSSRSTTATRPPTTTTLVRVKPSKKPSTTLDRQTDLIGKTTSILKSPSLTPPPSRVTPKPTTKHRTTGSTKRAFATVSPRISVKELPPAMPDELSANSIKGPLPPAPFPANTLAPHSTTSQPPASAPSGPPSAPSGPSFDGPPGEMPPDDNIVQMLNEADDFLEMARRLNISRKARIARRRRRMAEYGRW